jgi:hypothetical protein
MNQLCGWAIALLVTIFYITLAPEETPDIMYIVVGILSGFGITWLVNIIADDRR